MSAINKTTIFKRTSLIVYEADIFNCSQQIRHFGFLANRCRRDNVLLCRELLAVSSTGPPCLVPHDSHSDEPEADRVDRCPRCKLGSMRMLEILAPQADTSLPFGVTPLRRLQMDTS